MQKGLILIAIMVFLSACAGNFKEMRRVSAPQVKMAMAKLEQNDNQGALIELKKAEDANPYDPEVYYGLALTYRQWDKPAVALTYIDKAIRYGDKLGYEHPGMKSEAYNLKGDILFMLKRNEEAIEAFKNALKDDLYTTPEFSLHNMALVYAAMGKADEAQKSLDRALDKNPHYAPAWFALGQIYIQKGESVAAINALRHAILEFPDYTEAHWDIAQLYLKQGDTRSAASHLKEVVRTDKDGPLGQRAQRALTELGVYGDK